MDTIPAEIEEHILKSITWNRHNFPPRNVCKFWLNILDEIYEFDDEYYFVIGERHRFGGKYEQRYFGNSPQRTTLRKRITLISNVYRRQYWCNHRVEDEIFQYKNDTRIIIYIIVQRLVLLLRELSMEKYIPKIALRYKNSESAKCIANIRNTFGLNDFSGETIIIRGIDVRTVSGVATISLSKLLANLRQL